MGATVVCRTHRLKPKESQHEDQWGDHSQKARELLFQADAELKLAAILAADVYRLERSPVANNLTYPNGISCLGMHGDRRSDREMSKTGSTPNANAYR